MALMKVSDLPGVKFNELTDDDLARALLEISVFQYDENNNRIGSYKSMSVTYQELKDRIKQDILAEINS